MRDGTMKSGEVLAWRYRLDARLGVGGMGEVWRATHTGTGREFALKIVHARAASTADARQRFTHEAQASARIKHPAVVDVFDVGELEDGSLFLAMELLDGVLLEDALHAVPRLSVQDFVVILLGVTQALAAAHNVNIVHRDIKPANIFLHKSRETGFFSPKMLDFGVSKFASASDAEATKVGSVLGSPRYMSPEQARSAASVDARADIWSVGVLLFEGLTGTWPHEGDSFSSLMVAIGTGPPASIDARAPSLPESLRSIVRECLAPLDRRLPSAAALAARLEAALADPSLAQLSLPAPLHPPDRETRSVSGVIIRPPSPAGAIERPSRIGLQLSPPNDPSRAAALPAPHAPSSGVAIDPSPTASRPRMPSMTELVSPEQLAARGPLSPASRDNPPTSTGFRPVPRTMRIDDTRELAAHFRAAMAEPPSPAPPSTRALPSAQPSAQASAPPSAPNPLDPRAPPRAITFGAPPPMPPPAPLAAPPGPPPARAPAPTSVALGARSRAPLLVLAVVLGVAFVGILVALILTLRGPR
jgi:serine/threonine protein kinase